MLKILKDNQGTLLVPAFKQGYSLLLGSHQFYSMIKMIATIYERLVKAKSLLKE